MPAVSPSKYLVMAGWDDVPHLSEETKRELLESTPPHLRDARSKGIPVMGAGRIFPVDEKLITCEPFALPDSWPRVCGIDFGWAHDTSICWLAWDRDNDVVYLYDSVSVNEMTPAEIAPQIIARGPWIPCAWPHDGLQTEKGSGASLAEQYREQGVNMLHEMAQMEATGAEGEVKVSRTSVEASLLYMLQRMQSGRWKVFKDRIDWLSEFRIYHRDEKGKIVKVMDDTISASRYAHMMLRHAICPPDPSLTRMNLRRDYDWRAG